MKIIQARDSEIVQNNEGRQALLSHIHRMEKELYAHKDALEGPEAIIAALRKIYPGGPCRTPRAN